MGGTEAFFRDLVNQIEPDEIDVAVPMLRAHIAGNDDGKSAAASGFGIAGVMITPALVSTLASATMVALPLLKAVVEIVVPAIGAANDVASLRDKIKESTSTDADIVAENIPAMASQLEAQLVEAGFDADRSSEVTLICLKAMLSDPSTASELLSQLDKS